MASWLSVFLWRCSRMRIVNLVRSVLPNAYAAKARGIVLGALTVGAVYVYYLAVDADDAIPPAAADFIPLPPVVRAAPIMSSVQIIPEAAAQDAPRPAAAPRAELARDLQTALANANCYDGPVSGRWSAASQSAMSAFLAAANAHLPVDDPDEALLALVSSHPNVTCMARSTRVADARDPRVSSDAQGRPETQVAIAIDAPVPVSGHPVSGEPFDERSMLDRPWVKPEMLVPAVDMPRQAPPSPPVTTGSTERRDGDVADQSAAATAAGPVALPVAASVMKVSTASGDTQGLRFEGDSVISAEKSEADRSPPAEAEAAASPAPAKLAQRKAKAAKRRATRANDSSYGMSFNSIQRSLTSLFN